MRRERGLDRLQDAPIRRLDHVGLAGAAWRSREAIRISDGFYVAAAHALAADLLTSDARLARAPSLGVTVTLLRSRWDVSFRCVRSTTEAAQRPAMTFAARAIQEVRSPPSDSMRSAMPYAV